MSFDKRQFGGSFYSIPEINEPRGWENLSLEFSTRLNTNQAAYLHRLARDKKFRTLCGLFGKNHTSVTKECGKDVLLRTAS